MRELQLEELQAVVGGVSENGTGGQTDPEGELGGGSP